MGNIDLRNKVLCAYIHHQADFSKDCFSVLCYKSCHLSSSAFPPSCSNFLSYLRPTTGAPSVVFVLCKGLAASNFSTCIVLPFVSSLFSWQYEGVTLGQVQCEPQMGILFKFCVFKPVAMERRKFLLIARNSSLKLQ